MKTRKILLAIFPKFIFCHLPKIMVKSFSAKSRFCFVPKSMFGKKGGDLLIFSVIITFGKKIIQVIIFGRLQFSISINLTPVILALPVFHFVIMLLHTLQLFLIAASTSTGPLLVYVKNIYSDINQEPINECSLLSITSHLLKMQLHATCATSEVRMQDGEKSVPDKSGWTGLEQKRLKLLQRISPLCSHLLFFYVVYIKYTFEGI